MLRGAVGWLKEHWGLHWQNLDDRPGDGFKSTGNLWKHGRGWVQPWGYENGRPGFRLEWNVLAGYWRIDLGVDPQESEINWGFATPALSLWWAVTDCYPLLRKLGLEGPWPEPGDWDGYQKDVSLAFHEGSFHWTIWLDSNQHSSKTPFWRDGYFNVPDFLFGDTVHSKVSVKGPIDVEIPLPERTYKGTIEMKRETWQRPRLPWPSDVILRAHIDMKSDPLPLPGKGTTSYNCDEDATFSSTGPARNVADAVGRLIGETLARRERYGGRGWRPTKDWRKSAGGET
jgi:hypothetical protein